MNEADMRRIAGWIVGVLRSPKDEAVVAKMRAESEELCRRYPVPGID
jgi:glycine hydroxymethyltransferase